MQRDTLPLESLPSWCLLNDVTFAHCKVGQTEKRGLGLIAEHELDSAPDSTNPLSVLSIPRDLVLSAEAVEGFAKENKDFRQLLSVAGHQVSQPAFIFHRTRSSSFYSRPAPINCPC